MQWLRSAPSASPECFGQKKVQQCPYRSTSVAIVDAMVEKQLASPARNISAKKEVQYPYRSTSVAMVDTIVEQQLPPPVRKCFNQKEVRQYPYRSTSLRQSENVSAKKRYSSTPIVAPQLQWLIQTLRSVPSASQKMFQPKRGTVVPLSQHLSCNG